MSGGPRRAKRLAKTVEMSDGQQHPGYDESDDDDEPQIQAGDFKRIIGAFCSTDQDRVASVTLIASGAVELGMCSAMRGNVHCGGRVWDLKPSGLPGCYCIKCGTAPAPKPLSTEDIKLHLGNLRAILAYDLKQAAENCGRN